MTSTKSRASQVYARFAALLEPLGYRPKGRRGSFRRQLSESLYGLIGVNLNSWAGGRVVNIDPAIGVREARVNMIASAFRGAPYPPSMPTVVRLLSNLLPAGSRRSWTVEAAGDLSQVDACVAEIRTRGLPYIEQHMTLESMRQPLVEGLFREYHGSRYSLAVIQAMLGRRDLGIILLREMLDEIGDSEIRADQEFRRFVRRFESSPLDIYAMDKKELTRYFRAHPPD